MPTVYDIDRFMSDWARPEYSEPWDNDGIMLCEDIKGEKEIRKITVCLELNEKTLNDACSIDSDLIITHHPFIFHPLKSVGGVEYTMISRLMRKGISVLSYHTRLDAACGGVNDALAEKLELSDIKPFGDGAFPMGRYGKLPHVMTPSDLSEYIKNVLGCTHVRCALPEKKQAVETVAVLGGAGKDFIAAASRVADAFITSDLSHNSFISAHEMGICLYDAGHYHTENPVAFRIEERLKEEFPTVGIVVSDALCPYKLL